jgi:hypothetical protein
MGPHRPVDVNAFYLADELEKASMQMTLKWLAADKRTAERRRVNYAADQCACANGVFRTTSIILRYPKAGERPSRLLAYQNYISGANRDLRSYSIGAFLGAATVDCRHFSVAASICNYLSALLFYRALFPLQNPIAHPHTMPSDTTSSVLDEALACVGQRIASILTQPADKDKNYIVSLCNEVVGIS